MVDGRCEEAMWEGIRVGGCWREVVGSYESNEEEEVTRRIREDGLMLRRRVMDPQCVGIVRNVMAVSDSGPPQNRSLL